MRVPSRAALLRFSSAVSTIDPSRNEFIGSISRGLYYFKHPDSPDELGVAFRSCNFYEADTQDGGFGPLVGTDGNISVDPASVNEASFNYALGESSGLADQSLDHDDLLFDMAGTERP